MLVGRLMICFLESMTPKLIVTFGGNMALYDLLTNISIATLQISISLLCWLPINGWTEIYEKKKRNVHRSN